MEYNIEFIEGFDFCHVNGKLLDTIGMTNLVGAPMEFIFYNDKLIITEEKIYMDAIHPLEIIKLLCKFHEGVGEYDNILSMGRGYSSFCTAKKYVGEHGAYIIENDGYFDMIEKLETVPMAKFKENYPNFNLEKYNALMEAFDKYYENL